MKFPNWLSQRALQKQEAIALTYRSKLEPKSRSWTYAQLETDANQWADYLQILGVRKGDRFGILLTNHPRYILLVQALVKCEAIAVFLNIRLTARELQWQIEDSLVKYLFCDQLTEDLANMIEAQMDTSTINILVIDQLDYLTEAKAQNLASWSAIKDIQFEDIQGIFYTSGTTGKPKAVPLTYANHYYSAIASALQLGVRLDDDWLVCMPLFHVGGLAIGWRSVINGTKMTLLPKFDEEEVLEAIAHTTIISLVPTMLTRLLQHPQHLNLQKARAILLGGSSINPELIDRCLQLNLAIMPTYGMTETASQITTLASDQVATKRGSSGLPLFGNRLRIVDLGNCGQDVPIGEIGQILVQSACMMSRYLKGANSIRDGWLHTGDLGYLDHAGYLYVVSRRADLIISGGENIYPIEVESILLSHPQILEVCVVGKRDREWGEIVVAVIIAERWLSLTEIRDFCESRSLARYKLPKTIFIWESLPKNASGKLMRQQIRDRIY
jgi:O-succinylbenzoic acid--CoA ligase